MWKLGPRPRYSFSGNLCFKFSAFFLCSVHAALVGKCISKKKLKNQAFFHLIFSSSVTFKHLAIGWIRISVIIWFWEIYSWRCHLCAPVLCSCEVKWASCLLQERFPVRISARNFYKKIIRKIVWSGFIEPHGCLVSYRQQSQRKQKRFNLFNCLACTGIHQGSLAFVKIRQVIYSSM